MSTLRTATCPPDVLDWIAWYAEPELPSEVRASIDRHAAECLACREELAWVQAEGAEGDHVPGGDRVFGQLMARLQEGSDVATSQPRRRPRAQSRSWLAAAAAILVLMSGAWLGLRFGAPEPLYTATAASAAPSVDPAVEVIFREDASWAEIRAALESAGLRVASGPAGATGRLQLALAPGRDLATALAGLRESGLTLFAERALP